MTVRVGDRVRLIRHTDEHSSLAPGTLGTVRLIDSLGTVHVRWDDGSRLGMIPGVDEFVLHDGPYPVTPDGTR